MALRTYLVGKIHGVRLTDKSVHYQGSITLSRAYLDAAGHVEMVWKAPGMAHWRIDDWTISGVDE